MLPVEVMTSSRAMSECSAPDAPATVFLSITLTNRWQPFCRQEAVKKNKAFNAAVRARLTYGNISSELTGCWMLTSHDWRAVQTQMLNVCFLSPLQSTLNFAWHFHWNIWSHCQHCSLRVIWGRILTWRWEMCGGPSGAGTRLLQLQLHVVELLLGCGTNGDIHIRHTFAARPVEERCLWGEN